MIKKLGFVAIMLLGSLSLSAETLEEAVQHALLANPEVLFSKAQALSATQALKGAKGAYLPTITTRAGIGRESSKSPTTESIDGGDAQTLTRREADIELIENLFAGGAIAAEVKRNQELLNAEEYKLLGVADDTALDVVENYLKVLKEGQLVNLARQNLAEHRRILGMIQERSTAGVGREAELQQAEGRLSLSEANVASAESDYREAVIGFEKVVGEAPLALSWPASMGETVIPRTLDASIQKALDLHPTLKSAYADVEEAKAQYKVAMGTKYPRLDAVLSASANKNLDGLEGDNNDALAMLRVSYDLYRGGADLAKQRETAYQVQEAYEVKNNTILEVEESTRLSWNSWKTAAQRLGLLRHYVAASNQTRSAYQEQFKIGQRTLLDLLDSQNEYYQANIDYTEGNYEEIFSRYRILNSMGVLVPYLKGRVPVTVFNDDLYASHENIQHAWLKVTPETIPKPDLSQTHPKKPLMTEKHSTVDKHQVAGVSQSAQTQVIVPAEWYVQVGVFKNHDEATKLAGDLLGKGMKAFATPYKGNSGMTAVYLGPYEYRGHALLAMKELKQNAHIEGQLVNMAASSGATSTNAAKSSTSA